MKENILGTEKISKLFISFSIPAITAMVITGMQTIIDGLFVANVVGANAMASVNIAQPFFSMSIACSMMISIGSLSYMGRSLGEKDIEKTKNIFRTSLIILMIIGISLTLIGFIFSNKIAILLGANDILLRDTSMYIKVISLFLLPMFLMFQFGFCNRLIEKPDLYFKGMILSLVMNIVLNYVCVKVMNLGTIRAALATGMAMTSALFIVIMPMINKRNVINIFIGKYDKDTIIPVLYNGSSEGMTSLAVAVTSYIFNSIFMRVAGEAGVAAFTTINYISVFATYIMLGIGDGVSPIVSYNYGAGKKDRVKKILKVSYIAAAIVGIISAFILFFFGKEIVGLFVKANDQVIELAIVGSKILAISFIFNGFNIVSSAYFTAKGFAKESVIIELSRGLIFIIIGIIVLPKFFEVSGIWMSIPFAEVTTFGISRYLLKRYIE